MASTNRRPSHAQVTTHGGAPAFSHATPIQQLRRSVLSCFLFEGEFYEDGTSIHDRILAAASNVQPAQLAELAIEARHEHNLRHVSLLLLLALVQHGEGKLVSDTIAKVVSRADELSELLALYWKDGKRPLAKQLKVGLAKAFQKFDAYQLAKYDRAREIRLRDVLFMVHPTPKDEVQATNWKQLVDGTLPTPDTWETNLSAGADKKETFERLIRENNLGYFALIRNLRNMEQAGCDRDLVKQAILARKNGAEKLLPFRYTAAARYAPVFERELDTALMAAIDELPRLEGRTLVLVDVSGSMDYALSAKSDLKRMDAAATLASVINGDDVEVFSFSYRTVACPPRKGMAGVDAILRSQPHGGTDLAGAVAFANKRKHDRLIVITDEQSTSAGRVPDPVVEKAYMINVASYKNGVGYGKWTHIDGFSEKILHWIAEVEKQEAQ